jgi:hypothetical protein
MAVRQVLNLKCLSPVSSDYFCIRQEGGQQPSISKNVECPERNSKWLATEYTSNVLTLNHPCSLSSIFLFLLYLPTSSLLSPFLSFLLPCLINFFLHLFLFWFPLFLQFFPFFITFNLVLLFSSVLFLLFT